MIHFFSSWFEGGDNPHRSDWFLGWYSTQTRLDNNITIPTIGVTCRSARINMSNLNPVWL